MNNICKRCDTVLSAEARFCHGCGTAQDSSFADEAQRRTEERIAMLGRYLPSSLVRHLMVNREAPLGQRAVAAVVFADVSGFTAMSERMEPEDVLRVMNGCFEGMVEAVENHGGTVDKFIGDCLMAVFGVPVAHPDDAARAVRACREMFEYLERYNKTLAKPLGLSIGINYGPLVAGNLGSQLRMDYTVLGNTVNLSQRLEAAATSGQILVSEAVKKAAENEIEFESQEPIRVKGISQPVQVYLAGGDRKSVAARAELPCVGRGHYLGILEKALRDAGNQPLIVDLYGDDGVGKTCIAAEMGARWATLGGDPRKTVMARAPGAGRQRPYGAIGAWVDAVCNIEPEETSGRRAMKLGRLAELGVDAGWQLFLLHACEGGQASVGELDGASIHAGILAATRHLAERLSAAGSLIILDGYDRFDAASREIFERAFSTPPAAGTKILATRSRAAAPLFAKSGPAKFAEIKPLDKAGCGALAAARLRMPAIPATAEAFLAAQSGGNPHYLLELIESLLETGYIYPSDSGYMIRDDLAAAASGLSLVSLVRSRIDRLPVDQRYLLQAAALYGVSFPADVVCEAVQQIGAGPAWLADIASKGLLIKKDTHYRFAHSLICEAAVESLLNEQRKRLFTSLGAAFEGHPEGRKPENLPLLARFFADSEDAGKAAYYLERSSDYLVARGEFERAAEGYTVLRRVQTDTGAGPDAVAKTDLQAGRAWERSGRLDAAQAAYASARQLSLQSGISLRLAEAERHGARTHRIQGSLAEAAALIDSATASSRLAGNPRCEAWVLLESAEIDLAAQRLEQAADKFKQAEVKSAGLRGEDDEGSVRGRALGRLGRIALTANQTEQAAALLEEAAAVCDAARDKGELVRLYGNLGVLCHRGGRPGARLHFDRALMLARSTGDRLGEAKQLHNLGSYLLGAGEKENALPCFHQSYDLAKALDWTEGIAINASAIQGLERALHEA